MPRKAAAVPAHKAKKPAVIHRTLPGIDAPNGRKRDIRAAKFGTAQDAIGELAPGCETYILTMGQFSLIDALYVILEQTGPADVCIATWTAAHADLERSISLMERAQITSLRFLVDASFLNRQPAYCQKMRDLFGDACIRTLKTHAKFITIKNKFWNIAVRTSMNLNENPRMENLEISDCPQLCGFLNEIVDGVFAENLEGDFQATGTPTLVGTENVHVPGQITASPIGNLSFPTLSKRPGLD